MTFRNILFPTDFSERSRAMVPYVRALFDCFKASLTLLYVVHVPITAYGAMESPVVFEFPLAELKESAEKTLVEFAETEFPGMPVKTAVEEGLPGLCITEFAKEQGVDLIMMPTRGHGRLQATLLGSVTTQTLHHAGCAVWTMAHCDDTPPQQLKWESILCAIDTDDEGVRLISVAAELAAAGKSKVHLVHSVVSPDAASERFGSAFTEFLKERARRTIASMQKTAGTNFPVCLEAGSVPEVVHHAAEGHRADLVLIGRGVMPRFAGGLRSQAYAIVRDAPCPVLSV